MISKTSSQLLSEPKVSLIGLLSKILSGTRFVSLTLASFFLFNLFNPVLLAQDADANLVTPRLLPQTHLAGVDDLQLDLTELQLASPNVIIREFFGDGSYLDYHRELASDPIYPASMTKMMSTLVILRGLRSKGYDLHDIVQVQMEDVQGLAAAGASLMGLLIGESIPIREALYGILLPSGSDALRLLHRQVHDSEEDFVKDMNATAQALGMKGSHFANSTGLFDPYNYSTPEDLTLLLNCLLQDPLFRQICGTRTYTTPPTNMHGEGMELEHTIQYYGSKLDIDDHFIGGGKTGWLPEAGYCFTSYRLFGDRLIVVSTERALKAGQQIQDHAKIYAYLENHLPALPAGLQVPSQAERWPDYLGSQAAGLEPAGPAKPPHPTSPEPQATLAQPRILETMSADQALAYSKMLARTKNLRLIKISAPIILLCLVLSVVLIWRKKKARRRPTRRF